MSTGELDKMYSDLNTYILDLEIKYIEPHQDPLELPQLYDFDVRSFCILSHAAFEEFVENICIKVVDEMESAFKTTQRISYTTLSFLHFNSKPDMIGDDDFKCTLFEYLKDKLEKAKSTFSNYVIKNNHGVSLKYLDKMLIPLGLDIPSDARFIGSLDYLSKYRGGFAHTYKRNVKLLAPEDARSYVEDVNEMMGIITKEAKNIHYFMIHK